MICVLNRTVVMYEVIRWALFRMAQLLGCDTSEIDVKVITKGKDMAVTFDAPGINADENREQIALVYVLMKDMAAERLAGINTRRSK